MSIKVDNTGPSEWAKSVADTKKHVETHKNVYGSSSLTKGAENFKGTAYFSRVFENFKNTLHLKFSRVMNLFSEGKWVNNASAYRDLNSKVSDLNKIINAGNLTTEDKDLILIGLKDMQQVCTTLREAKNVKEGRAEGKKIKSVEAELIKIHNKIEVNIPLVDRSKSKPKEAPSKESEGSHAGKKAVTHKLKKGSQTTDHILAPKKPVAHKKAHSQDDTGVPKNRAALEKGDTETRAARKAEHPAAIKSKGSEEHKKFYHKEGENAPKLKEHKLKTGSKTTDHIPAPKKPVAHKKAHSQDDTGVPKNRAALEKGDTETREYFQKQEKSETEVPKWRARHEHPHKEVEKPTKEEVGNYLASKQTERRGKEDVDRVKVPEGFEEKFKGTETYKKTTPEGQAKGKHEAGRALEKQQTVRRGENEVGTLASRKKEQIHQELREFIGKVLKDPKIENTLSTYEKGLLHEAANEDFKDLSRQEIKKTVKHLINIVDEKFKEHDNLSNDFSLTEHRTQLATLIKELKHTEQHIGKKAVAHKVKTGSKTTDHIPAPKKPVAHKVNFPEVIFPATAH